MKGKEQQQGGSNDLALYISFLSTFYDRMTERHSRKNILRRQWLSLKQEMHALELDNVPKTKEQPNGKSQSRAATLERIRKVFQGHRVSQLPRENSFYVILGMAFLCQLVSSKAKEAIQRMQTDLRLSKPVTLDAAQHQYLLQKLEALFEYLLKVLPQKDVQLQPRIQAFSSEDSGILGRAIKKVLNTRNPKSLTTAVLSRPEPNDVEIQLIAQALDISLSVMAFDQNGNSSENEINKRGKFHVIIGFDEETDSYFQLEPLSVSDQPNDELEQMETLMRKFAANSVLIRRLGVVGTPDTSRNEAIRRSLRPVNK